MSIARVLEPIQAVCRAPQPRCKRTPARLAFADATAAAYHALARHHYLVAPPATFCRVRAAWHLDPHAGRRLVGVAVLSWPVVCLAARMRHFDLASRPYGERLRFANEQVRTVSRVIVHPQFRALGVGHRLVRELIAGCPTRYVEASAVMGEFARVFVAAGMTQHPHRLGEPAYFLIDRFESSTRPATEGS